jgi:hypothetical protein
MDCTCRKDLIICGWVDCIELGIGGEITAHSNEAKKIITQEGPICFNKIF